MAVDIVIQETIDAVDITVNPNIIEVNVTRTSGGGGGGIESVTGDLVDNNDPLNPIILTPNLTQVLNQGDISYVACNGDYQFVGSDIATFLINDANTGTPIFTIDGDLDADFPDNCVLKFQSYLLPSQLVAINGAQIFTKGEAGFITTYDFNIGDYCELKKIGSKGWFLNVSNVGNTDISGLVPYTGATQDVNLGEFGLLTGNIEFDNTPTNIPTGAGSMVWNDIDGTVDLKLKGANVTLQIGQESVIRVVNKTATNINLLEANYQAVRVTGAQGQRLKVDLAQATSDTLSAETIGLVTETINNNQEGFITTSGLIRNVNTTGSLQSETWADGDILYLSPTVAGQITKVKPVAPNHLVIIGYVIHAHATQGSIFVKVDNGYELDELHNVKIASATNNELLAYTSSTDIWENKSIATVLGYTPIKKIVSDTTSSSAVTGTTSETLCKTYTISANTFSDGDFMKCLVGLEKTGTAGTGTVRIRVNQTNNFATATLVGTYTPSAASHVVVLFKRDFLSFKSGVLKGIGFATSAQNDLQAGASIAYNTTTLSPTSDFYIYVSVINTSGADSTIVNQVQITN